MLFTQTSTLVRKSNKLSLCTPLYYPYVIKGLQTASGVRFQFLDLEIELQFFKNFILHHLLLSFCHFQTLDGQTLEDDLHLLPLVSAVFRYLLFERLVFLVV